MLDQDKVTSLDRAHWHSGASTESNAERLKGFDVHDNDGHGLSASGTLMPAKSVTLILKT